MTHPEETLKSSFHYCEPTFYPCKSDSLFSRVQFSLLFFQPGSFIVGPKNTRPPVDGDRLAGNSQPTFSVRFNRRKKPVFSAVRSGRGGHKQTVSKRAGKHPSLQTWEKKTRSQQESRIRDLSLHTSTALGAAASSAGVYPCQGADPSTCGYTHQRKSTHSITKTLSKCSGIKLHRDD